MTRIFETPFTIQILFLHRCCISRSHYTRINRKHPKTSISNISTPTNANKLLRFKRQRRTVATGLHRRLCGGPKPEQRLHKNSKSLFHTHICSVAQEQRDNGSCERTRSTSVLRQRFKLRSVSNYRRRFNSNGCGGRFWVLQHSNRA